MSTAPQLQQPSSDPSAALLQAAYHLQHGNHSEAVRVLRELQTLEGSTGVDVALTVLKTTPADRTEATYIHFASLRLLRFILIANWGFWRTNKEDIVGFLYEYMRSHISHLLLPQWKPVLREVCMAIAIVFKLSCAFPVLANAATTDFTTPVDTQAVHSLVQSLHALLTAVGPASSGESGATEPLNAVLARLITICTVEEFGLYEPSAAERGVPLSRHEECRSAFAQYGIPILLRDLLEIAATPSPAETLLSAQYLFRALSTVLNWRTTSLQDEDHTQNEQEDWRGEGFVADPQVWCAVFLGVPVPNSTLIQPLSKPLFEILSQWYVISDCCGIGTQQGGPRSIFSDRVLNHCVVDVIGQCCAAECAEKDVEQRLLGCASTIGFGSLTMALCCNMFTAAHRVALDSVQTQFMTSQVSGQGTVRNSSDADEQNLIVAVNGLAQLLDRFGCAQGAFIDPAFTRRVAPSISDLAIRLIQINHNLPDDDDVMAALDTILSGWMSVIVRNVFDGSGRVVLSPDSFKGIEEASGAIFSCFVAAKTSPAGQLCGPAYGNDLTSEGETGASEAFSLSHVKLVSLLGRQQPAASCQTLLTAFRSLVPVYVQALQQNQGANIDSLHDQMWCLLLLTSSFIGEANDSEDVAILPAFVEMAVNHMREGSGGDECANPLLVLVNEAFSFIEGYRQLYASTPCGSAANMCSPGVVGAALTLLQHYVRVYVGDVSDESPGSVPAEAHVYHRAFNYGRDALSLALTHLVDDLRCFPFDSDVTEAGCKLLDTICEMPQSTTRWVCAQQSFLNLSELALGNVTKFRGVVRGHLIGCLISLTLSEASLSQDCAALRVLGALLDHELTSQWTNDLLEAISNLRGVFAALHSDMAIGASFHHLCVLVRRCVEVAQSKLSEHQILTTTAELVKDTFYSCSPFLDAEQSWQCVGLVVGMIDVCEQSHRQQSIARTGQQSATTADAEEDERVRLVKALSKTISDVCGWASMDVSMQKEQLNTIGVTMVRGLTLVLSYLNEQLLFMPEVQEAAFDCLKDVSSTFTVHFVTAENSAPLLQALHFAMCSSSVELNRSGLMVMESVASYLRQSGDPSASASLLVQFLDTVLNMLTMARAPATLSLLQANCLISLCECIANEEVIKASFLRVVSQNAVAAGPLEALFKSLTSTPLEVRDRRARHSLVESQLAEVASAIKGTRIV